MIDGEDMEAVLGFLELEPDRLETLGDLLSGIVDVTGQMAQHLGLNGRQAAFVMISAVGSAIASQRDPAVFEQMMHFLRQAVDKIPAMRQEAIDRLGDKAPPIDPAKVRIH